ncbi:MAG: FMN-binding glutamate synthase family protein [Acidimicrobiales bacterium]
MYRILSVTAAAIVAIGVALAVATSLHWLLVVVFATIAGLVLLTIHDLTQRRHAILRNFPVVGHLRFVLESVGPELRQYIVTDNDEERPFSRDQRRWVYASAKKENSYFGFGTDNQLETPDYLVIRHSPFPVNGHHQLEDPLPPLKVLGEWRNRPDAFQPASIVNLSAMSYGSLSGAAVESINRGCAIAGALHNTGEGSISEFHRKGGELTFQFGTGYYGCRDQDGDFSLDKLVETVASAPVKTIEIKLSQGAKPGLGGVLPAEKVTAEIAAIRGVEIGKSVISPSSHSAFSSIAGLIDFVEEIANATGKPVGIKSAVGQRQFWPELADAMKASGRGPDYIAIDGGEGGTGAAPLVFSDHVSLPFRLGFTEVYRAFAERQMHNQVLWVGSGKLGFAEEAMLALTLGVDMVAVAREPMLAIGCIQAQECHTGHCPTGVATQNKRLARGLDPTNKADRLANYLMSLRYELRRLANACGAEHPSQIPQDAISLLETPDTSINLLDRYEYDPDWRK